MRIYLLFGYQTMYDDFVYEYTLTFFYGAFSSMEVAENAKVQLSDVNVEFEIEEYELDKPTDLFYVSRKNHAL